MKYTGFGLREWNAPLNLLGPWVLESIRTIEQKASNLVLGLRGGWVDDTVLQDEWQQFLLTGQFAKLS